jgi:hypothetical protein
MGGSALWLFTFLVHHQRRPDGLVHGGRPITYQWIAERLKAPPTAERTLRRWMQVLKSGAYIRTRKVRDGGGMIVSVVAQKKWPGYSSQGRLFPRPEPAKMPGTRTASKACGKPVEKPVENVESGLVLDRPGEAGPVPGLRPLSSFKKEIDKPNKNAQPAARDAVGPEDNAVFLARLAAIAKAKAIDKRPAMTDQELDARRRLLLDQVEQIRKRQSKAS